MPSYKTAGIILRRTNYGEADRIMTLLTPERGKIDAIAKGVRRINAKLASHLELFSEAELMLAEGKSLDVITSARLKTSYPKIVEDYERMRRAYLFCEMINKLTPHDPAMEIYQLLKRSLAALNQKLAPALVELYFKLQLLDLLGHRPHLDMPSKNKSIYFDVESGSVSAQRQPNAVPIHKDELKLWRLLKEYPLNKIASVGGVGEAAKHSLPVIDRFYDYLFDKHFKSAEI